MSISIGQRLGSYEITALLGEGGMGTVYRATDTRLNRAVAIKVCASQFSERFAAMAGHMWGQMSSLTYKQMKEEKVPLQDHDVNFNPVDLYNPLTGKYDNKFVGAKAYYRPQTLVSIWVTAPYLHNNSVGEYNGDPSIAGRMAAYEDGMAKLLWPERRLGIRSMKVTTEDSSLPDLFPMLKNLVPELAKYDFDPALLRVPKGTPLDLLT